MAVVRFDVENRVLLADGQEWGRAGAYERLNGTAYMEVDPDDPLNAVIVNLDKAGRNARGKVEFSAPFRILKPVDMDRGNHKIWYGVNNRGYFVELGFRTVPYNPDKPKLDPVTADELGRDNVLLPRGYAVVDAGWQGDILPSPGRLHPDLPIARNSDGSAVHGLVRLELSSTPMSLVFGYSEPVPYDFAGTWRTYEPVSTDTTRATLTVRDDIGGPRVLVPPDRWAWGRCTGNLDTFEAGTTHITLFDQFQPDKIYELTYTAKDPIVMGLGYAVTRDIASFLRYRTHDDFGNPNPLAASATETGIRKAYSSGTSSSGMYQREFLYLGFNEDEQHRRVFDAATIYSAGTKRLFANVQFAHPTFFSMQDARDDHISASIAPFTFAVTTDPVTGLTDGILKRPQTDPLVFQIDEELAFWQWGASLNVVDGHGRPTPVPDNVRLYHLGGFGHLGAAGLLAPAQPRGKCQNPQHHWEPTPYVARALAIAIDEWADGDVPPPPSNYPRLEDGSLVTLEEYKALYPRIPGMSPPQRMNEVTVLDFGPSFDARGGTITKSPPERGLGYKIFVPRPGLDGAPVAGVDTIWTRAPTGTNVGWNMRKDAREADLGLFAGSFAPFARSKSERMVNLDPRPSLEERYKDQSGFVRHVRASARALVEERFLLPGDADRLVQAAEASDIFK